MYIRLCLCVHLCAFGYMQLSDSGVFVVRILVYVSLYVWHVCIRLPLHNVCKYVCICMCVPPL